MTKILQLIIDTILYPYLHFSFKSKIKRLAEQIENEITDDFLELMLGAMAIWFLLDKHFRKNIEGFSADYVFRDNSGEVAASALFSNGKMKVKHREVKNPVVMVTFDKGRSLIDLLLSDDPNVFDFLLENRLSYTGNFNYLLKFAYLAKKLKLKLSFDLHRFSESV
jgi:hypothetical protein